MSIAITGFGVISPIGNNKKEVWHRLKNGESGLKKMTQFDSKGLLTDIAGEVKNFNVSDILSESEIDQTERCTQLAYSAASEALSQSDMESVYDDYRKGIALGTSLGGMLSGNQFHQEWIESGYEQADRNHLYSYPLHTAADFLSIKFKLKGPKITTSTACSAGANAIGHACELILNGKVDAMLAGGSDPLAPISLGGFNSLKALAESPCSPYSRSDGITLAEGSALLILERYDDAYKRGANILGTIEGYGLSSDAYHPTAPNPGGEGAFRSMNSAIDDANIHTNDIDYVNGHGTGTKANDSSETLALKNLFKDTIDELPVSSTKSMIGHTLGAAGAIESAISLLGIQNHALPPTINTDTESEGYGIDTVPNDMRKQKVDTVISNSFAFGGNNASIIINRHDSNKKSQQAERLPTAHDVMVTGVGAVQPLGIGKDDIFESLASNKSVISETSFTEHYYQSNYGNLIDEKLYKKYINPSIARRLDMLGKLSMASTRLAFDDGKLKFNSQESHRVGLIFGTGGGPIETVERVNKSIIQSGLNKVNPRRFPNTVMNAAAGHICMAHQIKGPSTTICSGYVSGSQAITYAYDLIKRGKIDVAVVVVADEYHEVLHAGYDKTGVLAKSFPSAFDKTSTGFTLSNGSTTLILESRDHAEKRGANMYASLTGYGLTSDAYQLTGNHPSGKAYAHAVKEALRESGLDKKDIDGVFSDANGMPISDMCEANAIKKSLGKNVPVTSVADKNGYSLSGMTPLHLLTSIWSMKNNKFPTTEVTEPITDINVNKEEKNRAKNFIINSSSFGGNYSSIVVSKAE